MDVNRGSVVRVAVLAALIEALQVDQPRVRWLATSFDLSDFPSFAITAGFERECF